MSPDLVFCLQSEFIRRSMMHANKSLHLPDCVCALITMVQNKQTAFDQFCCYLSQL